MVSLTMRRPSHPLARLGTGLSLQSATSWLNDIAAKARKQGSTIVTLKPKSKVQPLDLIAWMEGSGLVVAEKPNAPMSYIVALKRAA